jgi:hypothetical protein
MKEGRKGAGRGLYNMREGRGGGVYIKRNEVTKEGRKAGTKEGSNEGRK